MYDDLTRKSGHHGKKSNKSRWEWKKAINQGENNKTICQGRREVVGDCFFYCNRNGTTGVILVCFGWYWTEKSETGQNLN